MREFLLASTATLLLTACTTVSVQKIDAVKYPISRVCIELNPKVLVEDLIAVVEQGFMRHGIATTVFEGQAIPDCEYVLTYTAFRGWDVTPYMDHAELRLQYKGTTIGSAIYKHSGGLGLNKWASTESKLAPVIDELLAGYGIHPAQVHASADG